MNRPIKQSGYQFGNNVTFNCVEGYNLSGPQFITCRSSRRNQSMGHWSDQQPFCLGNYMFYNKQQKDIQMTTNQAFIKFICTIV